jgi:lysine 2,3-aminomutase
VLRKHHPLYINTHFNHPAELTPAAVKGLGMLADAGIPLGCQTVLLKDVNDDVSVMKALMQALLRARVRPYYIFMCDNVAGVEHFKATVQKGLEIMRGLRGWTSGLAVPHFVIDAPGGGGKIPLLPEYLEEITETDVILRNYEGDRYTYPQPRKDVLVAAGIAEPEYAILPLSGTAGSEQGGNGRRGRNGGRRNAKGKRA